MSNVVKSFRVVERESIELGNTTDSGESHVDANIVKDVLLYEARKEAEMIVEIAKQQSKLIAEEAKTRKEALINGAYDESKNILEEARKLGYAEGYDQGFAEGSDNGYNEGKAVSDNLIKESLEIKNGYIDERKNLSEDLEEDIIHLVIDIYEKILGDRTKEDDQLIISLVLNGIKNLDPTDKLTIISSKEDFEVLEAARDEILSKASLINELEIKYDIGLDKGDCILETAKGNIDLGIKDQLNEIRELLTTILNNE